MAQLQCSLWLPRTSQAKSHCGRAPLKWLLRPLATLRGGPACYTMMFFAENMVTGMKMLSITGKQPEDESERRRNPSAGTAAAARLPAQSRPQSRRMHRPAPPRHDACRNSCQRALPPSAQRALPSLPPKDPPSMMSHPFVLCSHWM